MAPRLRHGLALLLWSIAAIMFSHVTSAVAADWESPGGAGSYALKQPDPGVNPLGGSVSIHPPRVGPSLNPDRTYTRKVPTSDWWSPLVWVDPADGWNVTMPNAAQEALCWSAFPDPLKILPKKGGLSISYNVPDSRRQADVGNGQQQAGAGFMLEVVGNSPVSSPGISPYFVGLPSDDIYAGSTAAGWSEAAYSSVYVDDWSDWFMRFMMTAGASGEKLTITSGIGWPFVLVKLLKGRPQVAFNCWNVGTVVPLSGSPTTLGRGDVMRGGQVFSEAFALVNKVPFPKPDLPATATAYDLYVIYAVFGPSGSTWTFKSVAGPTPPIGECSTGDHYTIAILPYAYPKGLYDQPDSTLVQQILNRYAQYAFAEVVDSQVAPSVDVDGSKEDVRVSFSFTTANVAAQGIDSGSGGTLYALYPHHYVGQSGVDVLSQSFEHTGAGKLDNAWWWPTLKGAMLLAEGTGFVNKLEVPPCLPAPITSVSDQDAATAARLIQQALDSQPSESLFLSNGSYFGAQMMYRLAMLLPIAAQLQQRTPPVDTSAVQKQLYDTLTGQLGYRLQAVKNNALKNAAEHVLYYDSRWGALIPVPEDGFAADLYLNDLHFHSGYYIKVATEIARYEKSHGISGAASWASQYAPMIKLLIKNIANFNRQGTGAGPDFPFLRNFSPYVGHSWANGASRGDTGADQESSSEAMNALSALLLWAQLDYPADTAFNNSLEQWACYMLASEARALQLYWFGFTFDPADQAVVGFRSFENKSDNVPKPYLPNIVCQVKQNQMAFQTYFGNYPLSKYAIQWIPLVGSSMYLVYDLGHVDDVVEEYLKKDYPALSAGATPIAYKDQLLMYEALSESYTSDPETLVTSTGGAMPLDGWKMAWEPGGATYDNMITQYSSQAHIFWWIKALVKNGHPDHTANGADSSSALAYKDHAQLDLAAGAGGRHRGTVYTAYNPHDYAMRVKFADGHRMRLSPMEFAVHQSSSGGGSVIESVGSKRGRPGDSAWIVGSGFSTRKDANKVFFGDIPADVKRASRTRLTVIIPRECARGQSYQVVVMVDGRTSNSVPLEVR
ncbi:MAG: glycosyl hydrolase [Acidobacteriota bacterium]